MKLNNFLSAIAFIILVAVISFTVLSVADDKYCYNKALKLYKKELRICKRHWKNYPKKVRKREIEYCKDYVYEIALEDELKCLDYYDYLYNLPPPPPTPYFRGKDNEKWNWNY